jgi:hypothetical protein
VVTADDKLINGQVERTKTFELHPRKLLLLIQMLRNIPNEEKELIMPPLLRLIFKDKGL